MTGSGDGVLSGLAANLIAVEEEAQCPAGNDSMRPGCDRFCRSEGPVPLGQRRLDRAQGLHAAAVVGTDLVRMLLHIGFRCLRRQRFGQATFPVAPVTHNAGSNREL